MVAKRFIPVLLLFILAACSPGGAAEEARTEAPAAAQPAAEGEVVQLVYQDWRTDWFPGMAQRMLAEFHALHPNIRVFYTPDPEDVPGEMPGIFQAETAPDVVSGCCDFFPAWAQAGYLLDLRPYVARDLPADLIAEWDEAQYKSFFTTDGAQYALPKYHGSLAVYFNKDMFDAAGLPYPGPDWTYDDYLAAMTALTSADGTVWGSTLDPIYDRVQIHVNAFGGHYANPADPTDCVLDEPPAVAALDWLRARIQQDGVMATPLALNKLETRRAFWEGRVAMVEDGSWALKDILTGAKFRVGVAPFPRGPKRRVTLATTDGFGIFAGTAYPDAAWELVKFLTSKQYGMAMAEANYLQPARATLVGPWIDVIRRDLPEQTKDLDLMAFAEGHVQGYSVVAEIFANMEEARRLVTPAWEQLYTLGQGTTSMMKKVSEQIEAAQKETSS